jgi:hypothetical protein
MKLSLDIDFLRPPDLSETNKIERVVHVVWNNTNQTGRNKVNCWLNVRMEMKKTMRMKSNVERKIPDQKVNELWMIPNRMKIPTDI